MGKDNGNVGAGEKRFPQEKMTFDNVNDILGRLTNIVSLFGDNEKKVQEKLDELQMEFAIDQASPKNMREKIKKGFDRKPDSRFIPELQTQLAEKVEAVLDVIDESLSSGRPEKNTYARNVLQMAREQIGMILDPDYYLVDNQDSLQGNTWGHIIDFPVNRFATGDPEKDKRREFIKDDARYEEFMGKYSGFYDMMAERTDFVKKDFLPFQKRKKEGKTTEQEELQFNAAYRDHIDRQIGYWEKIKEYPEEVMLKTDPFARSPIQFTVNWAGSRGAVAALNVLNFQKNALNNGWSIEDITFLGNMYSLQQDVYKKLEGKVKASENLLNQLQKSAENAKKEVEKAKKEYDEAVKNGDNKVVEEKKKALDNAGKEQKRMEGRIAEQQKSLQLEKQEAERSPWVNDVKQLNDAYRRLTETVVYTPQDRRKLIEDMKPFADKWNELIKNSKNDGQKDMIITSCDEALKRDGLGRLTGERATRGKIIKSLEVFQKQLNQGHRIGSHTDSPEMKDLKKKLNTALKALRDNKKGIYDDTTMSDLLQDISKSARAYTDAKKEGAGVDKGSTTYLPKTKMGKIRYRAAMDLEKAMNEYSTEIKSGIVPNQAGKRMEEEKKAEATGKDPTETFLAKTDEALKRLETGKYDNKQSFIEDSAYALVGQMYRANGGKLPNKDGNSISLEEYKDMQIASKAFVDSLMVPGSPDMFISPKKIAEMANDNRKIHDMAKDRADEMNNNKTLQQNVPGRKVQSVKKVEAGGKVQDVKKVEAGGKAMRRP